MDGGCSLLSRQFRGRAGESCKNICQAADLRAEFWIRKYEAGEQANWTCIPVIPCGTVSFLELNRQYPVILKLRLESFQFLN